MTPICSYKLQSNFFFFFLLVIKHAQWVLNMQPHPPHCTFRRGGDAIWARAQWRNSLQAFHYRSKWILHNQHLHLQLFWEFRFSTKNKKYKQWLHSSSCYPQPTKTPVCTLLVVFCILKCRILKERISEIENNINTKSNLNFSIASSNSKMCPTLSPPYWTDTVVHSQVTQLSYLHVAYAKMYQTMPRRQNLKKHQEFLQYKQES